MAKLSLKATQKALGIGTFVEKTIKYRGKDGEEFEGEIQIKIVDNDTIINATDAWEGVNRDEITFDQLHRAHIYHTVYEDEKNKFFKSIEDTGKVSSEIVDAMFRAADEVLDFSGKNWISRRLTNSGASLSSMESVEEQ